jgi:Protein of unknown function (DUF4238)
MAGRSQHYLPRSYLRNFTEPRGANSIYAFNKLTGEINKPNLMAVCQETLFYDFPDVPGRRMVRVDDAITKAESIALPAFTAISNTPDEATVQGNRYLFSQYVAFLMARSAKFRREHQELMLSLRSRQDITATLPGGHDIGIAT